jgi:hypothetical protein
VRRYALLGHVLALLTLGCGESSGDDAGAGAPAGGSGAGGDSSAAGGGGEASDGGGPAGGAGAGTPLGTCGTPIPRISDGAPAYASGGDAAQANDEQPGTGWHGDVPGWLAYDLSSVPADQRGAVVVSWYAIHTGGYLNELAAPESSRPIDYAIEINDAGGGAVPTEGWQEVVAISGNTRSSRQHALDLGGANWVRFVVSAATDPGVGVDFDVHHAPNGPTDAWLLMGDSITFMSTMYAFSDLPARVEALDAASQPIVVDAGIGGTNTGSAQETIDAALAEFPGCYVALAFGTNDHADSFEPQMAALIEIVLAAGKTPVLPRMPWSSGSADGEAINAQIETLYQQYPEVLRGPDLWATFEGRTDLIPEGDVHPNGEGMAVLRQAWAETIAGVMP